MKKPRIVCTGPIDQEASIILEPYGPILVAPDHTEQSILPLLDEAVGLIVRGEGEANANIIETAKHLKVIGRSGVGYNNVDVGAATARGIPVIFTPGANARAVAEAAITLMLAVIVIEMGISTARHWGLSDLVVLANRWQKLPRHSICEFWHMTRL